MKSLLCFKMEKYKEVNKSKKMRKKKNQNQKVSFFAVVVKLMIRNMKSKISKREEHIKTVNYQKMLDFQTSLENKNQKESNFTKVHANQKICSVSAMHL